MPLLASSSACRWSSVYLRVAAVDDDVAGLEQLAELVDRLPWSASPAGTITQTTRGRRQRLDQVLEAGDVADLRVAVVADDGDAAALRNRSRMLPPILPRPTRPMCTVTLLTGGWTVPTSGARASLPLR